MDWLDLFLSTEPINRDAAKEAALQIYRDAGEDVPSVIFVESPADLFFRAAQISKAIWQILPQNLKIRVEVPELGVSRTIPVEQDLSTTWRNSLFYSLSRLNTLIWQPDWNEGLPANPKSDALMQALTTYTRDWNRYAAEFPKGWKRMKEKGVEDHWRNARWSVGGWRGFEVEVGPHRTWMKTYLHKEVTEAELRLSENAWATHLTPHFAFIMERPQAVHFDEMNRLSAYPGPAVEFRDGSGIFMISGIPVPRISGKLTVEKIHDQINSEVQRVLRESYGEKRYLADVGATLRHEDDYGKLWATNHHQAGERLVMVEVVNSTPEPDGTFKHYFLQVPPQMMTAREAVAWTFNVPVQHYAPALET